MLTRMMPSDQGKYRKADRSLHLGNLLPVLVGVKQSSLPSFAVVGSVTPIDNPP